MDILDDVVGFLCSVLTYFGFDIHNLGQLLQPLPVREQNIRHRSLVRRLGSRLPLLPPRRIRLQSVLLRTSDHGTRDESFCSEFSYVSSGGDNLVWIEEDLGNNCIMVRPRDKHLLDEAPEMACFDHDDIEMDGIFDPGRGHTVERTSTPVDHSMAASSVSVMSTLSASADPFTQQKIVALEDELAALRSQIALLIREQEAPTPVAPIVPVAIPPPPGCPPPPPPPPPPPCLAPPPPMFKAPSLPGRSLADLLKENKASLNAASDAGCEEKAASGPPSMSDVLKGLGTVKLRTVQRSPGGTPLKPNKPRRGEVQDPATMIAEALKKKFAGRVLYSPKTPDTDKEEGTDSPDSPGAPFGQQLLRKTKKRSLLFQERRRSASPLSRHRSTSPLTADITSSSPNLDQQDGLKPSSPLVSDAPVCSPSVLGLEAQKPLSPLTRDNTDKSSASPLVHDLDKPLSPLVVEASNNHSSPVVMETLEKAVSPLVYQSSGKVSSPLLNKVMQTLSSPIYSEKPAVKVMDDQARVRNDVQMEGELCDGNKPSIPDICQEDKNSTTKSLTGEDNNRDTEKKLNIAPEENIDMKEQVDKENKLPLAALVSSNQNPRSSYANIVKKAPSKKPAVKPKPVRKVVAKFECRPQTERLEKGCNDSGVELGVSREGQEVSPLKGIENTGGVGIERQCKSVIVETKSPNPLAERNQ